MQVLTCQVEPSLSIAASARSVSHEARQVTQSRCISRRVSGIPMARKTSVSVGPLGPGMSPAIRLAVFAVGVLRMCACCGLSGSHHPGAREEHSIYAGLCDRLRTAIGRVRALKFRSAYGTLNRVGCRTSLHTAACQSVGCTPVPKCLYKCTTVSCSASWQ